MRNFIRLFWLGSFTLVFVISISGAQVTRTAAGANAAAIQATVDQFRTALGGVNNGIGGSFISGRREINWDGVPDNFASPNNLPVNFFNVNSPRGAVFTAGVIADLRVSANSMNPTNTPVRFGEIDPSYPNTFLQTFSAQRLFAVVHPTANGLNDSPILDVYFYIPGTNIPATVSGFGVVFSDVDLPSSSGIICYGVDGTQIGMALAPSTNGGLSFVGITFNAGERISHVKIGLGNTIIATTNVEGVNNNDLVAMDDFIYGEPRASQFHLGDFDGDGFADASVFRPSTANFFVLNSGSNTVSISSFGTNGDIPVSGDFDGDQRADVAIYRPSVGEWWINRSSTGATVAAQFGQNGDRPTPGDFDKDGKTDIAFWRPSNGNYFILRSSNSSFFSFAWGQTGDLPVGAAIAP
ncbi:MAG TPA: VCBS repeat-containing protein [Pyrinomonadaceae bacterium]|nr:VCBS repeat-containing protein [Pyrinomonadaceae bacterium]